MIAETGEMWKVEGNSKEMVATGPIPGSTPIKVPITHPMKQKRRLFGWKITEKAKERFESKSMAKIQKFPLAVESSTTVQTQRKKIRKQSRSLRWRPSIF